MPWTDYKRREPRDSKEKRMALTRDFKLTVVARAQRDPKFRQAVFAESISAYLAGDTLTGKAALRDLVNATIGFEGLAEQEPPSHAGAARQPERQELL